MNTTTQVHGPSTGRRLSSLLAALLMATTMLILGAAPARAAATHTTSGNDVDIQVLDGSGVTVSCSGGKVAYNSGSTILTTVNCSALGTLRIFAFGASTADTVFVDLRDVTTGAGFVAPTIFVIGQDTDSASPSNSSARLDVHGSPFDDNITGGGNGDTLRGNNGNDIINGGAGQGSDYLTGGSGDDELTGEGGDDRLDGGSGNDNLFGNGGNDFLQGRSGDDTLRGGGANDIYDGGSGADSIFDNNGEDTVLAAAGTFYETIDLQDSEPDAGGDGIDDLFIMAGQGANVPTVICVEGSCSLSTTDDFVDDGFSDYADDFVVYWPENIDIGNDFPKIWNRADYDAADKTVPQVDTSNAFSTLKGVENLEINLGLGDDRWLMVYDDDSDAGQSGDQFHSGRKVVDIDVDGGAGADDINLAGVQLEGVIGVATLTGGPGDDILVGSYQNDVILGGDGADDIDSGASVAFNSAELGNRLSGDTIDGGPGDDTIRSSYSNVFHLDLGSEKAVTAGGGDDDIDGGAGTDTLIVTLDATADSATLDTTTLQVVNNVLDPAVDDLTTFAALERVEINMAGGDDSTTVEDLTGSTLTTVTTDGGAATDALTVNGGATQAGNVITMAGGQTVTHTNYETSDISLTPVAVITGADGFTVAAEGSIPLEATSSTGRPTLTYEWDLSYDGATFTSEATTETVTFTAGPDEGSVDVALRVTDTDARVSEISVQTITVTAGNLPPVARITTSDAFTVDEGTASIALSGSTSTDSDGTITAYAWDLDDDGSFDDAATADTSLTLGAPGTTTVHLQVTDDQAESGTATQDVVVTDVAPTAIITNAETLEVQVSSDLELSGATSSDAHGSIAAYAWDLDDDGLFDDGSTATVTYSAGDTTGDFPVTLRVTDEEGTSTEATATITVTENAPPVAAITSEDGFTVPAEGTLSLSGADSTDSDGTVTTYAWTTTDGTLTNQAGATVDFVAPSTGGTVTVTLTVTDNEGAQNATSADITVTPNTAPEAVITSADGFTVQAEGTLSLSGADSTDSDGTVTTYAWTTTDGTLTNQTGATVDFVAPNARGTFTVTLTVTDDDGAQDATTQDITVTKPAAGRVEGDITVGTDRIGTAIQMSRTAFPDGLTGFTDPAATGGDVKAVVVARAFGSPADALAGSVLAAEVDGPMLLSRTDGVSQEVQDELARLGADRVYLLGGTAALDASVAASLAATYDVVRMPGTNRYDTARLIANEVIRIGGLTTTAVVALGQAEDGRDAWPDALAAGNIGTHLRSLVVPVKNISGTATIPTESQAILDTLASGSTVHIAGGESAIPTVIAATLADQGFVVNRVAGASRYDTALALGDVANAGTAQELRDVVFVASGTNPADALGAVVAAWKLGGTLVLVHPTTLSASGQTAGVYTFFDTNTAIEDVYVAGGPAAISDGVLNTINALREN